MGHDRRVGVIGVDPQPEPVPLLRVDHTGGRVGGIKRIGVRARPDPVEGRSGGVLEVPEQVIEGPVLQHDHDDVAKPLFS